MHKIACEWSNLLFFHVYVTVHRVKFLIIKPTGCTNFSNLFVELNCVYFGQFLCPSSGVFHCTHSNGLYHTSLLTVCEQVVPSFSQQEFMLAIRMKLSSIPILLASSQKTSMPYTRMELSSILILFASNHQTCMTYTIAVCTVENSWWWTEELSEIYAV
jgi:hypothetical protein